MIRTHVAEETVIQSEGDTKADLIEDKMANIEAMIAPKAFVKEDKEPETLLMEFDKYVKNFEVFLRAAGKMGALDEMKIALLMAVGGEDMTELVEQAEVKLDVTPAVDAVVAAVGVLAREAVNEIPADSYETTKDKLRRAIMGTTNQVMSRMKLFKQMPQSGESFAKWSRNILKQSERCDWTGYGADLAALDAIVMQTDDGRLRRKIIAQKMNLEDAIEWGKTHEMSDKKADIVEEAGAAGKERIRKVADKSEWKDCSTCPRKHEEGYSCPGLKAECYECDKVGHYRGAKICKKLKKGKVKVTEKDFKKEKESKSDKKKKKKKKVRYVEEDTDNSGNESYSSEGSNRVLEVVKSAKTNREQEEQIAVFIKPRQGKNRLEVKWTADSGVRRTLLAEKHWKQIKKENPATRLEKSRIIFKPYSSEEEVPILGKVRVSLKSLGGHKTRSTAYVVKGETESLLGKIDAMELGIIKLDPRGKEVIRRISPVKKERIPDKGIISGGQTQEEIDQDMEIVKSKYEDMFKGTGKAKVPPIHIHMKEGAIPVAQKQRTVPIQKLKPLKKKLDQFVEEGIIEGPLGADEATGWVHNVVLSGKKWSPDEIRLNLDTRLMKKWVEPSVYPIPTVEHLRHELIDSDRFSKLDLTNAFHQFELDDESKDLFKFTTPQGIYRYLRLVMGTPPASGECHAAMTQILRGVEGAIQIKDDVLVHGKGRQHDERLEKVLDRMKEYGLTLRKEKCEWGQPQALWFGHIFTKQGMSPDPAKVENIKSWTRPDDKKAVKSFLQTVQFVAPYMRVGKSETYSDITKPLRELTKQGVHFKWTKNCEKSFRRLKELLLDETVLVNYDPERETRLYVDHGPEGIAATVAQGYKVKGQEELQWRTVYHSGRSLEKAERGYGKIEGESLAIYAGITINKRYLHGTKFTVVTDHAPLLPLYNTPSRPAPARVERHRSKLRQYDFQVMFMPGDKIPCDYGSRHPPPIKEQYTSREKEELGIEQEEEDAEVWINRIIDDHTPVAVSEEMVREATKKDPELIEIMEEIQKNQFSKETKRGKFGQVWRELHIIKGIVMRGARMVVPEKLRSQVIALAHEGHQGETKTIQFLRENLWFPNLSKMCKEYVQTCNPGCTVAEPGNVPAPIKMRKMPDRPWQTCAADFKGPIGGPRGYYLHVVQDLYSRWPEVKVTTSTAFDKMYWTLDESFAAHGVPEEIISDNGAPYSGEKWAKYAELKGFKIQRCTPEHPQGNGLCERFMKTLKKLIHASMAEKVHPRDRINQYLMNYRNTRHSTTGEKPSKLMMDREIRTKLPSILKKAPRKGCHKEARDKDEEGRQKQKEYADKRRRAGGREVKIGDEVYIKQDQTTIKPPWDPDTYRVTKMKGTKITAEREGREMTRDISKWKLKKRRPVELGGKRKEEDKQEEQKTRMKERREKEEQEIQSKVKRKVVKMDWDFDLPKRQETEHQERGNNNDEEEAEQDRLQEIGEVRELIEENSGIREAERQRESDIGAAQMLAGPSTTSPSPPFHGFPSLSPPFYGFPSGSTTPSSLETPEETSSVAQGKETITGSGRVSKKPEKYSPKLSPRKRKKKQSQAKFK